jgi:hypothetical protein
MTCRVRIGFVFARNDTAASELLAAHRRHLTFDYVPYYGKGVITSRAKLRCFDASTAKGPMAGDGRAQQCQPSVHRASSLASFSVRISISS